MELVTIIAEVLKYSLPGFFVLAGVWIVLNANKQKGIQKERIEIRTQALAKIVPLRLQAYERVILLLERITPESLLIRCDGRGKPAKLFHAQLMAEIRSEFEHNMAQQLYISREGWIQVVQAKEEVIALLNQSAHNLKPNASGIDLGKVILHIKNEEKMSPCLAAIDALKIDIHRTFRLIG